MPPNASRNTRMNDTKLFRLSSVKRSCAWAVWTLRPVVPTVRRSSRRSAAGLVPSFAATSTSSTRPCLPKSSCATRRSNTAVEAVPIVDTSPNVETPTMWKVLAGPLATTGIVSPTFLCSFLATPSSMTTSPGPVAQRPDFSEKGLTLSAPAARLS